MRTWLAYVLMVAVVLAGVGGAAEAKAKLSKADKETAKAAFKTGSIAYDGGDFETAAAQYKVAYDLTMDAALLFNLAQAYRLGGQRALAIDSYTTWLDGQAKLKKKQRDLGIEKEVQGHVETLKAELAAEQARAEEEAKAAAAAKAAEDARRAAAAKRKAAAAAAAGKGKPGAKPVAGKPAAKPAGKPVVAAAKPSKPAPVSLGAKPAPVAKPAAKPAAVAVVKPKPVVPPAEDEEDGATGDDGDGEGDDDGGAATPVARSGKPAPVSLSPDSFSGTSSSSADEDDARPFYKKWWFWTGVVVVVGAGVVTAVVLLKDDGSSDELGGIGPGRGMALVTF